MRADLLERYDRRVPRYTSYPTAPHFHPGVGAGAYRDWLGAIEDDSLSLYVHIPFCARMCWYCGCHTRVVARYQPITDYVATVLAEAKLVASAMGRRPPLGHMHWGGGTPSILAPDDIVRLADGLKTIFGSRADFAFAVEIDPRTLNAANADALAAVGVTRASLGVQDCNPEVQAAINRIQPDAMNERAVALLRDRGIGAINLDLMYGLPRQTIDGVVHTVERSLLLRPDRIALFGYAHVPWMKKHQRLIDEAALPGPAERWAQMEAAGSALVSAGFRPIGLDHFAREDDALARAAEDGSLARNFQGYTDDAASALIGLGASAIGGLPQGYAQNAVPIGVWRSRIERGDLATVRGMALDADDRLRRDAIMALMCSFAVDLRQLAHRHDAAPDTLLADLDALAPMVADGLVTIEGSRLRMTDVGRPFVRVAAAAFDRYLRAGEQRHARAV